MRVMAFIIIIVVVLIGGGYFAYQKFFAKEPGFYLNGKERMEIELIMSTYELTDEGLVFTLPAKGTYPIATAHTPIFIDNHNFSDSQYEQELWDRYSDGHPYTPYFIDVLEQRMPQKFLRDQHLIFVCEPVGDLQYLIRASKKAEDEWHRRKKELGYPGEGTGHWIDYGYVLEMPTLEYEHVEIIGDNSTRWFYPELDPGVYMVGMLGNMHVPIIVE